ncbi:hypothetical protein BH20ACT2_BH20ACT2_00870 [soil metagenome]
MSTYEPAQAIVALEARLAATSRAQRPHEHAAVTYRLGLAYAESPIGNPTENLRKALACYDVAAAIFDARYDPVENARVLNAAGAAHRGLGRAGQAAKLFEQAADLLKGHDRAPERAAALNNLGLARAEAGDLVAALATYGEAAAEFDDTTAEGRRGRAAALHNRGLAHAAPGTVEGLEAALVDYAEAAASVDDEEAPYHHGLIAHSAGVASTALSARRPADRRRLLADAITSFERALGVFTRLAFPYQHALARHNMGRALAATGDHDNLRRALACYEESVAMLDPRVHKDMWHQAYASLEAVEAQLADHPAPPAPGRVGHFAALVAVCDPGERRQLLRERLTRLVALPVEAQHGALVELALASVAAGADNGRAHIEAELGVFMELPTEALDAGLAARLDAHGRLAEADREPADRAFDLAIGDALGLSQRIAIRDRLTSMGFERP